MAGKGGMPGDPPLVALLPGSQFKPFSPQRTQQMKVRRAHNQGEVGHSADLWVGPINLL